MGSSKSDPSGRFDAESGIRRFIAPPSAKENEPPTRGLPWPERGFPAKHPNIDMHYLLTKDRHFLLQPSSEVLATSRIHQSRRKENTLDSKLLQNFPVWRMKVT
jgi:hypothetical protein